MKNIKKITVAFLILSFVINPFFLKRFTLDGTINLENLSILLYISSSILIILSILSFFFETKKLLLRSTSIIFFFILSILICEFLFLKFNKFELVNKSEIRTDKNFEFEATYNINEKGFREKNFNEILNYENKIFLIGDSFVFGSGVDEPNTIDKLLENKLIKEKIDFKVINLGVPGAGVLKYFETLKDYIKFNPKFIFMFIYIDNDIIRKVYSASLLLKFDKIIGNSFLLENIKILTGLKIAKDNIAYYKSDEHLKQFDIPGSTLKIFKNENVNPFILHISNRGYLDKYYSDLNEFDIQNSNYYKNIFKKADMIAKNSNVEFCLVIVPSKYQIKKKYVDFAIKNLGYKFLKEDIINDDIQKSLKIFANENKINLIDLTEHLKKSENDNYYMIDDHFNKIGNKLVAEQIFNYLSE